VILSVLEAVGDLAHDLAHDLRCENFLYWYQVRPSGRFVCVCVSSAVLSFVERRIDSAPQAETGAVNDCHRTAAGPTRTRQAAVSAGPYTTPPHAGGRGSKRQINLLSYLRVREVTPPEST
jgi:hypothetical protein